MRLFVAADLSDEQRAKLRAKVTEAQAAASFDYIRWLPEENWHATLAFLGDRSEEEVARIVASVDQCFEKADRLEVAPGRIQCFPSRQSPRLLALKGEPNAALSELHFHLGKALDTGDMGRGFVFHVSVARFKEQSEEVVVELNTAIRDLRSFDPEVWPVRSITLYESQLSQVGATYRALHRWG
jgi:2'-5' RNA ligase